MGLGVRIEVDGAREFRAAATAAGKEAVDDLKRANKAAAEIVKREAVTLVPVLTGKLQSSIRPAGTKTAGIVRAGFKSVPWAGPVHWGWAERGIVPRPFLVDALDARRGEVLDRYQRQVDDLIERHRL